MPTFIIILRWLNEPVVIYSNDITAATRAFPESKDEHNVNVEFTEGPVSQRGSVKPHLVATTRFIWPVMISWALISEFLYTSFLCYSLAHEKILVWGSNATFHQCIPKYRREKKNPPRNREKERYWRFLGPIVQSRSQSLDRSPPSGIRNQREVKSRWSQNPAIGTVARSRSSRLSIAYRSAIKADILNENKRHFQRAKSPAASCRRSSEFRVINPGRDYARTILLSFRSTWLRTY